MSNLTINERIKDIGIPRQNENFYSNLKQIFGEIIKFEPQILNQLEITKKGFFLEEENFDFIGKTENLENENLLKKGYEETTVDNFHNEKYNAVNTTIINEICSHKLLNKVIDFKSNSKTEKLFFEKKENEIFVYLNNKKNLLLEIKCVNGLLIDFGFDSDNFLYIFYKNNEKYGLIKTHKTFSFFTKHDENISIIDLENCESFFNIKNIEQKEILSIIKYTHFNPSNGNYGVINDSDVKGSWKRYKIKDFLNTKIIATLDAENRTSSFTLLKELSDKIKKYPFRLITKYKSSDFSSYSFEIKINAGNGINSYYTQKGYFENENCVMLFGNLLHYDENFNVIIENDSNINLFTAIDFYEYEEKEYDKCYAENYFNVLYNYNNSGNYINNLLFLKQGYKTNVWVSINSCVDDEETTYPFYNYIDYKKQIITNEVINENNKVKKITFDNASGDDSYNIPFQMGTRNYWIFYKIEMTDIITNKTYIEYFSQKVFLKTENLVSSDLSNSKLLLDNKKNIYLINKQKKIKINPIKKYYCFKDNFYYYNKTNDTKKVFNLKKFKQIEHLFLYELIKLFGLENFKTKNFSNYMEDFSNISSVNNKEIKKLFKFKFDNTLNGVINFFNFAENNNRTINFDNGKFLCKGNFFNKNINNYNGNFTIKIKLLEKVTQKTDQIKTEIKLIQTINEIDNVIENKILYTSNSFDGLKRSLFYSNLEFYFYNYEYNENEEFKITIYDLYNQGNINFIKTNTYVENKIIPGIQDIKYKIHNPKDFVFNNNTKTNNMKFKIIDNYLVFENILLNKEQKLGSKLNQDNFKIPLLINNKVTNTFKTLNAKESFYVEYENLINFESDKIKKQIEDEKEIILILEE